ncbi:MAG: hypothetical protein ACOY4M_03865 [Pseudomonadota bacterium]
MAVATRRRRIAPQGERRSRERHAKDGMAVATRRRRIAPQGVQACTGLVEGDNILSSN